jgi:hypothetical protein
VECRINTAIVTGPRVRVEVKPERLCDDGSGFSLCGDSGDSGM